MALAILIIFILILVPLDHYSYLWLKERKR
jgi:hypothetical protein